MSVIKEPALTVLDLGDILHLNDLKKSFIDQGCVIFFSFRGRNGQVVWLITLLRLTDPLVGAVWCPADDSARREQIPGQSVRGDEETRSHELLSVARGDLEPGPCPCDVTLSRNTFSHFAHFSTLLRVISSDSSETCDRSSFREQRGMVL